MNRTLYVGCYSDRNSRGLYACRTDAETGALGEPVPVIPPDSLFNPTFIAVRRNRLYAVGETGAAQEKNRPGLVRAYRLETGAEHLTPAADVPCGIGSPCHLCVFDDGRRLAASQYKTGELYIYPLDHDGLPGPAESVFHYPGAGPVQARQEGPHIHAAAADPTGQWLFAADLGLDTVFQYRIEPDRLVLHARLACPPGSGPRHLAFSADGAFLWVTGELDSSIIGFKAAAGVFRANGHFSIRPPDFAGENWPAEIRLHPNGRWLYATNRGADEIVTLAVRPDGSLALLGRTPSGAWPRGMILGPDGRFLYAASQHQDRIDVFAIPADTGIPEWHRTREPVPSPVGFAFGP